MRAEATQEVMKALTLDPGHGVARKTLARLLVEAPPVMPDEAEEAMAANNQSVTVRRGGPRATATVIAAMTGAAKLMRAQFPPMETPTAGNGLRYSGLSHG